MTVGMANLIAEEEIPEDLERCLKCLYSTIEGTCPLDRGFGLDGSAISRPSQVARNILSVDIIEKTERYEPRVKVTEVSFEETTEGVLIPTIKLKLVEE